MRGLSHIIAAALILCPATAFAQDEQAPPPPSGEQLRVFSADMHHAEEMLHRKVEVVRAVEAFFAALRSEDKTALRSQMLPDGVIYIHIRTDPTAPQIITRSIAEHLERWEASTSQVNEMMSYDSVLVDGDMAQVWGPYRFVSNGETSHCGFNSISLARHEGSWKVGNTSFSVIAPDQCAAINAPEAPE